jgi:hypothetical protein
MTLLLFLSFYRAKINVTWIISGIFILFSAFIGMYYVGNLYQVLFGFWAILPFFYGIFISRIVVQHTIKPRYIYILWLMIIVGIVVDLFYSVPWSGFKFDIGQFQIQASRQWWTFGISRVSGFARASFEASIQVLILSIVLIYYEKRLFAKLVVWLISGIFIGLTTTKTVMAIWIIISLYFAAATLIPRTLVLISRFLIAFIVVSGVTLPYISKMILPLEIENQVRRFLFLSFQDRLVNIWPGVLELVAERGNALFGRGLGGIGAAQMYYEINFLPADNLSLYLYAIGGVFGVVLLLGYGLGCSFIYHRESKLSELMIVLTLSVLLEGISVNVLESPYFSLVFGITFSYWYVKMIKKFFYKNKKYSFSGS